MEKHYFSRVVNGCKKSKFCKSLFLPVILFCNNIIKVVIIICFGDVNSFKTGNLLCNIPVLTAVLST
jgi:hypothetical protein